MSYMFLSEVFQVSCRPCVSPRPCLCCCRLLQTRERDWANVITCHAGDPAAYTWRLTNFTLGEHVLTPPPDPDHPPQQQQKQAAATAVAISCCGNFGLVGSDSGRVDRYNLQSGMHRGTYWRKQGTGESQCVQWACNGLRKILTLTRQLSNIQWCASA